VVAGDIEVAALRGRLDVVSALASLGANVNTATSSRMTPLHAAVREQNAGTVDLLTSLRADVNMCNVDGELPLYTAVVRDHVGIARALLDAGATVPRDAITFAQQYKRIALFTLLTRAMRRQQVCRRACVRACVRVRVQRTNNTAFRTMHSCSGR
jgi:hypothetical protein